MDPRYIHIYTGGVPTKYVLKIDSKYYIPRNGIWTHDQAVEMSYQLRHLNPVIYHKVGDRVELYNPVEIPSDVYKFDIAPYLDDDDVGRLQITNKSTGKLMKGELLQRRINRNRSFLSFVDLYKDQEGFDEYYPITEKIPKPTKPYGVPDVDPYGNPIQANIESNDQWELLSSMVHYTSPDNYRQDDDGEYLNQAENIDKWVIEELFKNDLVSDDSAWVLPLVDSHGDPIKILRLIHSDHFNLRRRIVDGWYDLVETQFMKTSEFSKDIHITPKTITKFAKLPDYPAKYAVQIIQSDYLHQIPRLRDDLIKALGDYDFMDALDLIEQSIYHSYIRFDKWIADVLYKLSVQANDVIYFVIFFLENINSRWQPEDVISILELTVKQAKEILESTPNAGYKLMNYYNESGRKELFDDFFSRHNIDMSYPASDSDED